MTLEANVLARHEPTGLGQHRGVASLEVLMPKKRRSRQSRQTPEVIGAVSGLIDATTANATGLAGLVRVLVGKGILTRDEWVDAVEYIRAAEAVEWAVNPELKRLQERLDRALGKTRPKRPGSQA